MNLSLDFKKNRTQSMIFVGLVALLVLLVYFNLLLKPQVLRVADAVIKASRMSSDLRTAKSNIDKIGKFKKDIEAYRQKVDRYEKMLPAEQEIPGLLESLSAMAKSANIKIVGITPMFTGERDRQKSQIYREIPILVSAKSGYHELGRFLGNLENSDRFMKVADIQIKSNRTTPKKHDVELLILTYILLKGK